MNHLLIQQAFQPDFYAENFRSDCLQYLPPTLGCGQSLFFQMIAFNPPLGAVEKRFDRNNRFKQQSWYPLPDFHLTGERLTRSKEVFKHSVCQSSLRHHIQLFRFPISGLKSSPAEKPGQWRGHQGFQTTGRLWPHCSVFIFQNFQKIIFQLQIIDFQLSRKNRSGITGQSKAAGLVSPFVCIKFKNQRFRLLSNTEELSHEGETGRRGKLFPVRIPSGKKEVDIFIGCPELTAEQCP